MAAYSDELSQTVSEGISQTFSERLSLSASKGLIPTASEGMIRTSIYDTAGKEISFSSFEMLEKMLSGDYTLPAATTLLCTEENLTISRDFEIPPDRTIIFRYFTVPEGITLSVAEGAEVQTYGLTVQGNIMNRGRFIQEDLSAEWADEEIEIIARIPGHVENKGEMVLTDVFGKSNVNRFGGQLTINETGEYQDKLQREISGDSAPTSTVEVVITATPTPTSAPTRRFLVRRFLHLLEYYLPRLSFFLVLISLFIVIRTGIASSLREKRAEQSGRRANKPTVNPSPGQKRQMNVRPNQVNTPMAEDQFERDSRRRMEQLEEWLGNGMIGREEYNELKHRYGEKR